MVQNSDVNHADYDPIAGEYAEIYFNELAHKPLDRQLLDKFAGLVEGLGPVCDLGCAPGQIARYLKDRGAPAFGLDMPPNGHIFRVSGKMVEKARQFFPAIETDGQTQIVMDDQGKGES